MEKKQSKIKRYIHKLWYITEPFINHLFVCAVILFAAAVTYYFTELLQLPLNLKEWLPIIEASMLIGALCLVSIFTMVEMSIRFKHLIDKERKDGYSDESDESDENDESEDGQDGDHLTGQHLLEEKPVDPVNIKIPIPERTGHKRK